MKPQLAQFAPKGDFTNPHHYADQVAEADYRNEASPCEYGHLHCSLEPYGPCSDELLSGEGE